MNKKNCLALIFFIPELNVERLFPLRLHNLPNSELIHIIPKKFPWDLTMYSLGLKNSSQIRFLPWNFTISHAFACQRSFWVFHVSTTGRFHAHASSGRQLP